MSIVIHIIEERYPMLNEYKKRDAIVILEYVWKNACQNIQVADILDLSGADTFRVYPILFDFEKGNIIKFATKNMWGSPTSIHVQTGFIKQYQMCMSNQIKKWPMGADIVY